MEPYTIDQDGNGDTVITHPSGLRQVLSKKFMARMETQRRAIRQGFIDNNPCGFNCPKGRPYSCGCDTCEENDGYFGRDEILQFTKDEIETIAAAFKDGSGYLGPNGCRLPRYLRSLTCLSFVCQEY